MIGAAQHKVLKRLFLEPVDQPPRLMGGIAGHEDDRLPVLFANLHPAAHAPLDLKSLETRLRETQAISVFTKLALRNQIQDLLERFRAFHQGRLQTSWVELRQSFDLLVMKVLALLQDADASLAGALASSRESLWGILSDPAKLATV